MSGIYQHPFKVGIMGIINDHLEPRIAINFVLTFENEIYSKDLLSIYKQNKSDRLVLEVAFRKPSGFFEHICDVYSWENRKQTEYRLLRGITDKIKAGKIGQDWTEKDLKISNQIKTGKYETPDEPNIRN